MSVGIECHLLGEIESAEALMKSFQSAADAQRTRLAELKKLLAEARADTELVRTAAAQLNGAKP